LRENPLNAADDDRRPRKRLRRRGPLRIFGLLIAAAACGSKGQSGATGYPDGSTAGSSGAGGGSSGSGSGSGSTAGGSSGSDATDGAAASSGDATTDGSVASNCPTQPTSSMAQPMPVISRNVPAFASSARSGYAVSAANSSNYDAYWESSAQPISSTAPAWIAYDLSGVPTCQRAQALVSWYQPETYDGFDPFDFTIPTSYVAAADVTGDGQYGLPMNYTLEGNAAAGGSSAPPSSGWVALLSSAVTNNVYHARSHSVTLTGYNWLRMTVTEVTSSASAAETPVVATNRDVALKLDVQDASLGFNDSWMFLGDSITSHCMCDNDGVSDAGAPYLSLPELVHASVPNFFPAAINGGMGGAKTVTNPGPQVAGDAVNSIDTWLALFPGKFVGLSFGTNDCAGDSWGIDTSIAAFKTLVNKVLAAGKVPVVPHVPWAPGTAGISDATGVDSGAPYAPLSPGAAYNAQIDSEIYTISGVVRGPDLWSVFENQPQLFLDPNNLHPNDAGIAVYRQAWATAMLAAVYPSP
jgi:hypothetical protein